MNRLIKSVISGRRRTAAWAVACLLLSFSVMGLFSEVWPSNTTRVEDLVVSGNLAATSGTTITLGGTAQVSVTGGLGLQVNSYSGTLTTPFLRSFNGDPNGTVPAAKGSVVMDTSTPTVWINTTGATAWSNLPTAGLATLSYAAFGNGFDGSPTFDGAATILGMVPVSSVYTLVRDIYLDSPIINAGVTLNTAGFRIFVATNLAGPGSGTAIISDPGGNGGNGINGGGGAGGVVRTPGVAIYDPGTAGAPGVAGTTFGNFGAGHTLASPGYVAGTGGIGGTPNPGGAGGGGGTQGSPVAWSAVNGTITNIEQATSGISLNATFRFRGGTGGSAGGAGGGTSGSGGGGGGGGICYVAAKTVTNPTHLIIHADGGSGGNAFGTAAGGGGGGGGGYAILILGSGTAPTVRAAGGALGAGAGTGGAGSAGSSGQALVLRMN